MDLNDRPIAPDPYELLPQIPAFSLTSPAFAAGQRLPDRFTGLNENKSPELQWKGFPAETKSFLVTCFDPDAPTPSGFWHWTMWVPGSCTHLPENAGADETLLPAGAVVFRHDGSRLGYTGPKPPVGDRVHRYYFAVNALDTDELPVSEQASCASVAFNTLFHTLARGVLVGTYQR